LRRESQSSIVSSIAIVPSRWEKWRLMRQIYAWAKFSKNLRYTSVNKSSRG
jgi:hypothetical protein